MQAKENILLFLIRLLNFESIFTTKLWWHFEAIFLLAKLFVYTSLFHSYSMKVVYIVRERMKLILTVN